MARLSENLTRLSLQAETVVTDAAEWQPDDAGFDAVLVDAPCASTGTIRRHPDVAWLQAGSRHRRADGAAGRLLQRAAALLKPGGTLVYCTCSLEPEEGEQASRRSRDEPAMRRAPVEPARSPASAKSSTRTAICVPCPATCRTMTPLGGSTAFTPPGWSNPDSAPHFRDPS